MAEQLQAVNISAPAFKGLNTEDSPLGLDFSFAAVADNCIIDNYGRVGVRNGLALLTTDPAPLGSSLGIEAIHEFEKDDGTRTILSAGNLKIFSGTTTLTDITPVGATITDDDWRIVNFNGKAYFFQRQHEPLVYEGGALVLMSASAGATGTPPQGGEVLAAYGRLWVADFTNDKQSIKWSDLLNGSGWTGGSSGSLNVTTAWPDGYDEVVGLAAYNDFLIIFGRTSILVYQGANDPATMVLVDTITGIGLQDKFTIQNTGTDLLFLSNRGLMSLARTIQEKSMPMRDISKNVRRDLLFLASGEGQKMRSVYSPENAFYLLILRSANVIFCFDMRGPLEDGAHRVTRWVGSKFKCFVRREDGSLYVGGLAGVGIYSGYNDDGDVIPYRYYSHPLSFGNNSVLKILKKILVAVISGAFTEVVVRWGFDFSGTYESFAFSSPSTDPAEYGIGEYGIAEFSGDSVALQKRNINASGDGALVSIGVEVEVSAEAFSLQEFTVHALMGRII